jgi:hypothetical protein
LLATRRTIEEIEDKLLSEATNMMSAVVAFPEVDPAATEPPESWVQEYGQEEAEKRLRVARLGWLPGKDAPVGISIAKDVANSIRKARSERHETPTLNLQFVQINDPTVHLRVIEVDK